MRTMTFQRKIQRSGSVARRLRNGGEDVRPGHNPRRRSTVIDADNELDGVFEWFTGASTNSRGAVLLV